MRAVRGEQRNGYAEFPRHSSQRFQVSGIVAITAVLIFDLHGDDRPAAIVLQRCDLRQYHAPVGAHRIQKRLVAAPDLHPRTVHQPPRQSSVVTLAAGIRPRTDDHMKPQFPGHTEEGFEVQIAIQSKPALFRFGEVPENVALDAVAAQGSRLFKPVAPAGARQPEKMNHAGDNLYLLSGYPDGIFFEFHQ